MAPVMVKMKLLTTLLDPISEAAYRMVAATLRLACLMLVCSLTLLVRSGGLHPDTYRLYYTAAHLHSNAAGVLIAGNLAACFLESRSGR